MKFTTGKDGKTQTINRLMEMLARADEAYPALVPAIEQAIRQIAAGA